MLTGKLQLEFAEADFATIAASAVDILRPAAELKGVRLETALALQGATVLVDPLRIRQVVWNLVSNAVKFTPAGGTVTMTLRRAGRHFRLVVEDDGIGIPRQFLPYVFDRFRQADPSESSRHGENGYQLLSRLRAMGRTLPAAAITALARPEDRVRALASGFQAHLTNPVEPAELVATVAKLAARSRTAATTASRRESGRGR